MTSEAGADAGLWLAQARWLQQQGQERYVALGQQAATLLGFQSATVAIVAATAADDISRWASWTTTGACVLGVVAAGLSSRALWPRKIAEVDVAEFARAWATMVNGGRPRQPVDAEAFFVEQLAHGRLEANGSSPLSSITAAADSRGRWVQRSVAASATTAGLVGAMVILNIAGL